jgi:acyl-CoA dehydrogenase
MFTGQLGEFAMIEYPLTDTDLLETGDAAFAMGLSSVNVGKTQTSMKNVGMATHMLYDALNHAYHRYLYGRRVTDMPHIRRALLEAWSRILMARLYGYRAADYFRQADAQSDRRYLLFNPVQKARAAYECERAVGLLHNVMAARAYETETFAETAVRQIGSSVRLEGTTHVNMGQAVKFVNNYFNDNIELPDIPDGTMIKDDSKNMFVQGFGKVRNIKFADYRQAFQGCFLPNVQVFLQQAEAFKTFSEKSPASAGQSKNMDFMLNIAEIFTAIVYGQLVFEKAKIRGIEEPVVDQLFSYLVRDINSYVMRQLNEYAGHFDTGQRENLLAIIKDPHIDFAREEYILNNYVLPLNDQYKTSYGVVINA